MDGATIRTLAEYIRDLRRRDRHHNRTGQCPAFDTKVENDLDWDQRNRSGDGGRGQDSSGQGRHNLC